jgi:hypothetical protein
MHLNIVLKMVADIALQCPRPSQRGRNELAHSLCIIQSIAPLLNAARTAQRALSLPKKSVQMGNFHLNAGRCKLSISYLTNNYGRVGSFILSCYGYG